jgi:hypothetical protein
MKNLSENQTKIIESIISEFEKINEVKSSNSNKLFDVNIIYDNIEKEKKLLSEIIVSNRHMKAIYNDKIKEDTEKLNDSLNVLGIKATQMDWGIVICRIDGGKSHGNIRINYNTETIFVAITSSRSERKIGKLKDLTCYLYSPHRAESFTSIEDLCKENGFERGIQRLFN